MRPAALLACLALLTGAGCSSDVTDPDEERPAGQQPAEQSAWGGEDPPGQDLDLGVSDVVTDSVYPALGDARVDVLHYDLDLAWRPGPGVLSGIATIQVRGTGSPSRADWADDEGFTLDLDSRLKVSGATIDGEAVEVGRAGQKILIPEPLAADERHVVVIEYAGRPGPVEAPTTRHDFTTVGLNVTDDGELWTMQEPFGAHTWYPANDQPSDKALYDVRVNAPAAMTGVSGGELIEDTVSGGRHLTHWRLVEPASTYLTTLAVGRYVSSSDTSAGGVRIDHYTPADRPSTRRRLAYSAPALDWLVERLGEYPFDTLGSVVVDSSSAMETQTMITYGDSTYTLSRPVIVHELAHHWFGNQVSPTDWSDLWMNEGMAMLMQWLWEDEHGRISLTDQTEFARAGDQRLRETSGPPGSYDPGSFAESNVYHSPALMWLALLDELGEEQFFEVHRAWLAEHDNATTDRDSLIAFWEAETGLELSAHFDAWLLGSTTPEPGLVTG